MDFSGGSDGKESACNVGDQGWEDPLEKWQPTPVLLPGKFHGWRNLVGYNPRDRKESDRTEQFHFTSYKIFKIFAKYN